MAIRYLKLEIHRGDGAMHRIVDDFPAWEKEILEAVHTAVEVRGEVILNRDAPEAADEYMRLERRYGRSQNDDGSKGIPYVSTVYGQHGPGIAALKRAIAAHTVETVSEAGEDLLGNVA